MLFNTKADFEKENPANHMINKLISKTCKSEKMLNINRKTNLPNSNTICEKLTDTQRNRKEHLQSENHLLIACRKQQLSLCDNLFQH